MKEKNVRFHVRNVYKRFLVSFFAVLVLPIAFFFFLFLKDFKEIYQEKIIEQAEISLNATAMELEREFDGLWSIASYNSQLAHMQDYAVKKAYTAEEITDMLRAEVVTHSILKNICYYTEATPERVYTQNGTYSRDYFIEQYMGDDENAELILEQQADLGSTGWRVWNKKVGVGNGSGSLYYIVRVEYGKLWLFMLSETKLQSILNNDNGNTVLLDAGGTQLFPFEQTVDFEMDSANYYKIVAESPSGAFQLVRLIDKGELFSELYRWQRYFFTTLVIVVLLGSVLSFVLATYNERPVRELQVYCNQEVKNIPDTIEGFEVFQFAMKKMKNQVNLMEEKRKKNNLLVQLLFGWECDAEKFSEKMREAGLFRNTKIYRVIVAAVEEKNETDSGRLELYLNTEIEAGYEIHRVDFDLDHQEVFIVGMPEETAGQLEEELLKMIDFFCRNLNMNLFFYVGEQCDTIEKIHLSYLGIVAYKNQNGVSPDERIMYCKSGRKEAANNLYPDIELNTLYEALEEADLDKVNIMTDVLIDILEKHSSNRFLYISIYYDILNAYYRAQSKLVLNLESALLEIEQLEIKDNTDAIQMVRNIEEQYKNCIDKRENKKDKYLVSKVMEYIEENKESSELSVSMVADYFEMSISNLSHRFKIYTNRKISDYITEKRFEYAGELLQKTDYRISDIADMLGYTQTSNFIRKFKQYYGVTPVEYRNMEKESGEEE